MKKTSRFILIFLLIWISFSLTGCATVGSKSTSMSVVYGVITVVSLLLLVVYCVVINKKEFWFVLLFSSVFVVNIGYFALSISKTLEEALLANRIAYLGSVFLPMAMFMIIMKVCRLGYKKWLPCLLLVISVFVFLVAASPGYCDIYYKDVTLQIVNGTSVLDKTYGEWHSIYMLYLAFYFGVMIFISIRVFVKKSMETNMYAIILVGAIFVNISVWLIEQFVNIDFEILSVSYIISEYFMLCLALTIQEHRKVLETSKKMRLKDKKVEHIAGEDKAILTGLENTEVKPQRESVLEQNDMEYQEASLELNQKEELVLTEQQEHFLTNIHRLTPTENTIYDYYLEGKTTKEIIKELNITENTLKYHNKNIYSKLGVSSRKNLVEIVLELKKQNKM